MKELKWFPFFYNGLETNAEINELGEIRKIKVDWLLKNSNKNFSITKNFNGYNDVSIQVKTIGKKQITIHQLMASVFLNYKFKNKHKHRLVIDHKDSNKINNKLDNLRVITFRENLSKERTIKSGLPVGVSFHNSSKKYRSRIRINGIETHLGLFKTIDEASIAYKNKLKEIL